MSTDNVFGDEVAFVTGAGSGIGQAVARRLAARGAKVGLFDIDQAGLRRTTALIAAAGSRALPIEGDVTREADVRDAVRTVVEELGPLRTVVACAGIEVMGTIPEMDAADWHRVVAVNLTGIFHTARHAIPALRGQEGAAFVAIASDAGIQGSAGFGAYCASKHGVVGLVRALSHDHGPEGIRCNAVCPGFVETPMAERIFAGLTDDELDAWRATVPLGRFAKPEEVAAAVAHITSEDASYMNGALYTLDGGSTAGPFQAA